MTSVDATHYKKFAVNEQGDIDLSAQTRAKTDSDINSKCEVQLTSSAYGELSQILKEKLAATKETYGKTDAEQLDVQKKRLQKELITAKDELDKSSRVMQELVDSYKTLNPDDAVLSGITRDDQTIITKNIDDIRKKLKMTKDTIDKLNGSIISNGVFGKVDIAINDIKNKPVAKTMYLKEISLGGTIEGRLFTSGFRFSNRNMKNVQCWLVSVDVNKKIYKVKYISNGKDVFVYVDQKNMCLVNDDKNISAPVTTSVTTTTIS